MEDASTTNIAELNRSITAIIRGSVHWLVLGDRDDLRSDYNEPPRPSVRLGRRKLSYLLNGSSNTTAMNLRFNECPYWGALAFLSVRKIERCLDLLALEGVLKWEKSPQLKLNVLDNHPDWDEEAIPNISGMFAESNTLPIDKVDRKLYSKLKRVRLSLNSLRPYKVCTDKVLMQLCIHKPTNMDEFREKIIATKNFTDKYAHIFIQYVVK